MSKIDKKYRLSFNNEHYKTKDGFEYFKIDKQNTKGWVCKARCSVPSESFGIYRNDICRRFGLEFSYLNYEHIIITTTAVSFCHPSDKYDEAIGKRIAESRCKEKLFLKIQKILAYYKQKKMEEMLVIDDTIYKYFSFEIKEANHINKLTEQ